MSDIPRGMMATAASSVNRSGPRPWVAAALSILLPGLGHAYSGRYLRGLLWLSPVIAAFFGALLVLDFAVSALVNAALSPTVLWGVFWLNIVGAVWRISAATDAFSLASAESAHVTTAIGVAVGWSMLLLLAVAPHLIVARYTLDAISLVSSVFVADGDLGAHEPVIPIGTDADIVPDPALPVVVPGSARVFESIFDESAWDPDAIKVRIKIAGDRRQSDHAPFLSFNERVGARRITVLIAGGDAGPGRGGMRTDTMIVASMHTGTGRAALFSFPRNLGSIPLPEKFKSAFEGLEKRLAPAPQPLAEGEAPPEWESCECFPDQMNSIYPHTRRWTRSYPNEVDPGMAALRDVIEGLMGVNIDYYMLLDMAAFVDLV
ncbi:MAG: DUF6677 family protein, partial [Acidimicrobiia bacterium]